jgi:hypothetical protein
MITNSKQISAHFHSTEFRCQHCGAIKIDENLVNKMEHIFSKVNASKCIISSGHRCATYDKQIGSFLGRHYEGLAADCCYYDKNGNIIPSKIICCVAYDLGELNGIAKIDNNYVHLDNRQGSTYRGDETRGNSSYWSNPYSYFGVSKSDVAKYTGESVTPSTPNNNTNGRQYQSHGVGTKWYPNVTRGDGDYAGVFSVPMDGLYIDGLRYRVKTNGKWLPEVTGRSDYAGIIGSPITDVAIEGATYRVHNKTKNYWLDWVSGYDINNVESGYAGNGSIIDAIQIK